MHELRIRETALPGVLVIEPRVYEDARGSLQEVWNRETYARLGVTADFVQDNVSISRQSTLRGLHFQHPLAQGKLIQVLAGEIFDVAVDIRKNSPTFRRWVAVDLSDRNHRQVYIPEGFAHGFCVISGQATVLYKCTGGYRPGQQRCIHWGDPELKIDWPVSSPVQSDRDAAAPRLMEILDRLPLMSDCTAGRSRLPGET